MTHSSRDSSALATPRLRLHLLQEDDADWTMYRNLYADPAVMRRIAEPLGQEAALRGFRNACRHNSVATPGHRFWRAACGESQTSAGLVALRREGKRAEIGVMLFSEWWNRGLCSEIFVAVLRHGFECADLEAIDARSAEDYGLPIIERLLAPFGFVRIRAGAPDGIAHWELSRDQWMSGQV